jgi:hypothetical protein
MIRKNCIASRNIVWILSRLSIFGIFIYDCTSVRMVFSNRIPTIDRGAVSTWCSDEDRIEDDLMQYSMVPDD